MFASVPDEAGETGFEPVLFGPKPNVLPGYTTPQRDSRKPRDDRPQPWPGGQPWPWGTGRVQTGGEGVGEGVVAGGSTGGAAVGGGVGVVSVGGVGVGVAG